MRWELFKQPIASLEPLQKNKKMFINYCFGLVYVYVTVVSKGALERD